MKRLLWINACMRKEGVSRTDELCRAFLEAWLANNPDGEVVERDLTGADLPILTAKLAVERDEAVRKGNMDSPLVAVATEMAGADTVVIGAPYWDLSFPAVLKVYLEWASTLNVTFHYDDQGKSEGLCKADKLLYITTGGGPVYNRNHGYEYIKALSGMLGIHNTHCVAGEFLDVADGPCRENMRKAKEVLTQLARDW